MFDLHLTVKALLALSFTFREAYWIEEAKRLGNACEFFDVEFRCLQLVLKFRTWGWGRLGWPGVRGYIGSTYIAWASPMMGSWY